MSEICNILIFAILLFPIIFLPGLEVENLFEGFIPIASEADTSVIKINVRFDLTKFRPFGLIGVMVDIIEADVILVQEIPEGWCVIPCGMNDNHITFLMQLMRCLAGTRENLVKLFFNTS